MFAHGDLDDQIAWLQKDLVIEPVLANPEVLRLTLPGKYPEDLATILNKLMDVYVKDNQVREQARLNGRVKLMEEIFKTAGDELLTLRRQLDAKEREHGLQDQKLIPEQIQRLEAQRQPFMVQRFALKTDLGKADFAVKNLRLQSQQPPESHDL